MLDTPTLAAVLESIAQIDRELTSAIEHADVICARTYGDARTLWELRRHLMEPSTTARALRERLVMAGETTDEWEVMLRERSAAVLLRLGELAQSEHEAVAVARYLYVGKFRSLVDVNVYVIDEMSSVTSAYFRARLAIPSNGAGVDRTRRVEYANARLEAHSVFDRLGRDADLIHFLRVGAGQGSAAFSAACQALIALFKVEFAATEVS